MWLSETSWRIYDLEYMQSFGRHGFAILSSNLRTGELEFFGPVGQCLVPIVSFQPGLSSCPISNPRYKELRVLYDGSYNCLVQTVEATPWIIAIEEECARQPADGLELS
ncbi:unnamed protein product [Linum tenue]|uniref:Uncharacterized protein n=1 Tax=Linum tenue TaxID=586396 RepID=A0AAV0NL07_9ROSI|nr:unnamed protein product [Linum tenue]